jgi:addiction module RelE/StbE family toxin
MKLFYTPESIEDLERLREFIAVENPKSAQRISSELVSGISKLKVLPNKGRKVMQSPNPEKIRDLSVGKYIVRYLILENEIHILRIWHRREDWYNDV